MNTHRCIIPPASKVQLARDLCRTVAGLPGDGMFLSALTQDGKTISHYISAGTIAEDFAALLDAKDVQTIHHLATTADEPMTVTQDEIQSLLDESDISTDQPFDALARLGLALYQTEEI